MSPNPWCWFLLSLFNALAHRFRWRPSTASTYRTNHLVFSAGFPTSVVPFFKGAGFQVLKCSFCFGEVSRNLRLGFCILLHGFRMFMGFGSVKEAMGHMPLLDVSQASQPSRSKHFGGKQTIQSWTCLDHLTDWMFEPFFLGGGDGTPYKCLKWHNKASIFFYKVPTQNQIAVGCCEKAGKLGGLVSTYESPCLFTRRDERYHHFEWNWAHLMVVLGGGFKHF